LAQLIENHLNELQALEDIVSENAEKILSAVNLDELLKDPEGYMLLLGDAFLSEHIDEIEQASKVGKRFARRILNES
tara:strand:- start:170 stop:400 length:231 start_codon:yes stop_codon:yes gene_type:complete